MSLHKYLGVVFFSLLLLIGYSTKLYAQANASINILTQNSGVVQLLNTIYLQVDVGNSGPTNNIGVNKVRAQISIPSEIAIASANIDQDGLPPGWIILNNNGSTITVCNGTDIIGVSEVRTVLIKIQGIAIGGPSTISGSLSFGPGTGVCTGLGSLPGDIPADNNSTTTIQVTSTAPVILSRFSASLINCTPNLIWTVASEINTARYEIERASAINTQWQKAGVVIADGNVSVERTYQFSDNGIIEKNSAWLYRLKMIDNDGTFKYSNIVKLTVNCINDNFSIYPNPVKNKLFITSKVNDQIEAVTLITTVGQVVLKSNYNNRPGYIDLSPIPNGMYVLTIRSKAGITEKFKILVQH